MKLWASVPQTLSILMVLCFSWSASLSQILDTSFENQYEKIRSLPDSSFLNEGDSLIKDLYQLNFDRNLGNDSLVSGLLLEYFQLKRQRLSFEESLRLIEEIRNLIVSMMNVPYSHLADLHYQLLVAYNHFKLQDSSSLHRELMATYIDSIQGPTPLVLSLAYENAKQAYYEGDFYSQLAFLSNGLDYLNQHFPDRMRTKLNFLNGIGIGYRRTRQYEKAIEHHNQTLAFIKKHGDDGAREWEGNILNNLGLCHNDLGHYQEAINYMKQALRGYQKLGPNYQNQIATEYSNIAKVFADWGNLDSARIYNLKSLEYMKSTFGENYYDLLLPVSHLSHIFLKMGKLTLADSFSDIGLQYMRSLGWTRKGPQGDYFLEDGLNHLATRVEIERTEYDQFGSLPVLERAVETGKDYMATIDYAFDGMQNSPSKEIFQKFHSRMFSLTIDNLYTLYTLTRSDSLIDQALNYIEKYKSLELLYAAQKDKIGTDPIFQRLNQERSKLQDSISRLEAQLVESGDPSMKRNLDLHRQRLYQWQREVRDKYPEYHSLVYQPDFLHIPDLQFSLSGTDHSLLTYHLVDTCIYLVLINRDDVRFEKVIAPFSISDKIASLRNEMFAYFLAEKRTEQLYEWHARTFVEAASDLYDILLAPIAGDLKRNVTIIPDKALGYLSFDLLISSPPEDPLRFKTHNYFIRDHVLNYSYSIHLLNELTGKKTNSEKRLLVVAPSFQRPEKAIHSLALRSELGPLGYNEVEADAIINEFSGDKLSGKTATKAAFLSLADKYQVIHLATHGKANDKYGDLSYLAFTDIDEVDFRLLANEIYPLDLDCELVTLSACETGLGELQEGEGIISLARAFSFAGARSIVSSLWSVNDGSTAEIMARFYHNLALGNTKDVALQKAKLDYLNSGDHIAGHPFFWSAFIGVGDMRAFDKEAYFPYILLLAAIMVALGIFWHRTKRSHS